MAEPIIETKINTREVESLITRFAVETDQPVRDVLRTMAKGSVRELAALTPPSAGFNPRASFAEQRRVGLAAVESDVRSVFLDVRSLRILQAARRPAFAEQLEKALTRDREKAADMLTHAGVIKDRGDLIDEPTDELHSAARDRRGRVRDSAKRKPYLVRKRNAVSRFVRRKQAKVGLLMSGWSRAAAGLGVKLPQWITKQGGEGHLVDNLRARDPSIRMTNNVRYAGAHNPARIEAVVRRNAESKLRRQLEAKVQGAWNKLRRSA